MNLSRYTLCNDEITQILALNQPQSEFELDRSFGKICLLNEVVSDQIYLIRYQHHFKQPTQLYIKSGPI